MEERGGKEEGLAFEHLSSSSQANYSHPSDAGTINAKDGRRREERIREEGSEGTWMVTDLKKHICFFVSCHVFFFFSSAFSLSNSPSFLCFFLHLSSGLILFSVLSFFLSQCTRGLATMSS